MIDRHMSLEEFRAKRHAEIPLFLLLMKPNPGIAEKRNGPDGKEMQRRHYLYLWELEEAGKLLGSGPREFGKPAQEGMAILLVRSREEAEEIARREPYGEAGWRTNRIETWHLNEGVAVDLARRALG